MKQTLASMAILAVAVVAAPDCSQDNCPGAPKQEIVPPATVRCLNDTTWANEKMASCAKGQDDADKADCLYIAFGEIKQATLKWEGQYKATCAQYVDGMVELYQQCLPRRDGLTRCISAADGCVADEGKRGLYNSAPKRLQEIHSCFNTKMNEKTVKK